MNFLFPTFLIGLSAIAIPIIIHLFNFRKYKKVYFTNVQFLKELKQESDSKSKLKEWFILVLRILAIICLVFAFAQPIIFNKNKTQQGQKAISIYIDNSFSMESLNKKGSLLENAKNYATDIANIFKQSDKFQLLTNDFEGKHQRFVSKEEFVEQLNTIHISSATKNINDVIKRQQDFLNNSNSDSKHIFLLSDFQKNISVFSKPVCDTNITVTLIPLISPDVSNVFIDSVWFETPLQQLGTAQVIYARINNKSNKNIENGSLKLFINQVQISLSSFNIDAEQTKDITLSFTIKTKGINKGFLKIEDYPITYDDTFYFSFNSQNAINTLVINGKESKTANSFKSLLQQDSLFDYKEYNESSIDYNAFKKANTIILNELTTISSGLVAELQKFTTNGGTLILFPSKKADLLNYNTAFSTLKIPQIIGLDTTKINTQAINFDQGLYEGVFDKVDQRMDLPKTFEHFKINQTNNNNAQNIITLQNGDALLSLIKTNNASVYLFSISSDAASSNLLKHALFVPTIIKMAILSIKPSPIYYKTSSNQSVEVSVGSDFSDKPLHIVKDDKTLDVIPEHRIINNTTTLFTQNQITEAGHYQVNENAIFLKDLAFNFDRKESDMSFFNKDDLQKQIDEKSFTNVMIIDANEKSLATSLTEISDGKKLWKLFLVLTLVFLLLEITVIRLFK